MGANVLSWLSWTVTLLLFMCIHVVLELCQRLVGQVRACGVKIVVPGAEQRMQDTHKQQPALHGAGLFQKG